MSSFATISELSTWTNMRLAPYNCCSDNILIGLMEGERMKCLVEKLTGSVPKRLGSLEGLTLSQKVTRVDWFIDILKKENILPQSMKIEAQSFAQCSTDHIYPMLWHLISSDVAFLWQIAPTFQSRSNPLTVLSEPIKHGPCSITKTTSTTFYKAENGKLFSLSNPKRIRESSLMEPEKMMKDLVNSQLKTVPEGKRLGIQDFDDITDSKILCALVNSFVPGTFTSEVLLNDRWTINLALSTASSLFGVETKMTSGDLHKGEVMGSVAFLTYLFMSGYQFLQAKGVVERFNTLQQKQKGLQIIIQEMKMQKERKQKEASILEQLSSETTDQETEEERTLIHVQEELDWISATYDVSQCQQWVSRSIEAQAETRNKISLQMNNRFDIITVPENTRSMTIRSLCEENVVNLALTGGSGFYACDNKENLWSKRRLVVRHKESGEFYDDFSGAECPKGSVRNLLGLHPTDIVEVASSSHPDYELFYESSSRNKMLKAGSRFLYQVFPGTPSQSQRLLRQAAKAGDLETVEKLTTFYESQDTFVNITDPETGNSPLHLASRHGHFRIVLHLLEKGSNINAQNNSGCTPFFVAVEGLNKDVCQLLIEWGGNIDIKNKKSKKALDIVRNPELKTALQKSFEFHTCLTNRLHKHDIKHLEKVIGDHLSGEYKMASLNSRCVDGYSLLHWTAKLGSVSLTQKLLNQHIDPNLESSTGETALHLTRSPAVAKVLLTEGAEVNHAGRCGNTPLHKLCMDKKQNPQAPDLLNVLIDAGVDVSVVNDEGFLAIHCAARLGNVALLEAIMNSSVGDEVTRILNDSKSEGAKHGSILYSSLINDHIVCAQWLAKKNFHFEENEAESLAHQLLINPSKHYELPKKIDFLLMNGLDSDASFKDKSLLHLAAEISSHPEIVELLLGKGANVNSLDRKQMTPLFMACMHDNFHGAKTLLEKGADFACCDIHGKTAFDYIKDYEEWMECGYFTQDTRARLKAYSLKHSRLLIRSLTQKLSLQGNVN